MVISGEESAEQLGSIAVPTQVALGDFVPALGVSEDHGEGVRVEPLPATLTPLEMSKDVVDVLGELGEEEVEQRVIEEIRVTPQRDPQRFEQRRPGGVEHHLDVREHGRQVAPGPLGFAGGEVAPPGQVGALRERGERGQVWLLRESGEEVVAGGPARLHVCEAA